MNQIVTAAIVLRRTDYGEADRILTLLTPAYGKLSLLARGVRKAKSKLAGGIELFSVSEITFIKGRGDVGTLVSTRLVKHYDGIVKDFERTMLGYELIKQLHKVTEDEPEEAYFLLLEQAFEALNDVRIPSEIIRFWFETEILRIDGHTPNLRTDSQGNDLSPDVTYSFSFDDVAFTADPKGKFSARHIKFLRVVFGDNRPKVIASITGSEELSQELSPLILTISRANHP